MGTVGGVKSVHQRPSFILWTATFLALANLQIVSSDGTCSVTIPCSPVACCSKFGNCGFTQDHCGNGCVGACDSKPPATDCSAAKPCKVKACCSKAGFCGFGPTFCQSGCQGQCDAKPECGKYAGNSDNDIKACPLHVCCGKFGFCGTTEAFCTKGCQRDCSPSPVPNCGNGSPKQFRIGYYESWSKGRKCGAVLPDDIDTSGYTHINFAFGSVQNGLMTEPTQDEKKLLSSFVSQKDTNSELKILISVGGWVFSDPGPTQWTFHNIVASSSSRARFISSVKSYLNLNGLDGIDIDWEYPTAPDRGGLPTDTDNYVKLIKEMRSEFQSRYLITIAAPASYWYLKNFKIGEMSIHLDWINLMTYDFNGVWNKDSGELGNYLRSHTDVRDGVKPEKIAIGLGKYGRSYTLESPSCNTIEKCKFKGAGSAGRCTNEAGILGLFEINEIMKQKKLQSKHDEPSNSEILTWDDQWVSFDNEKSLDARKNLAAKYCLRGTMVWAIDLDEKAKTSHKPILQGLTQSIKWRQCLERKDCCKRREVMSKNPCSLKDDVLQDETSSSGTAPEYIFPRLMSELSGDFQLSELSIPGTHDSGSFKHFSAISRPGAAARWAQTQDFDIYNQLYAGIRALDIRCHHINNKFAIHHGPVSLDLGFGDVLETVTKFLKQYPGEVVLMRVKEEHGDADKDTNKRSFAETMQEYIDNYSEYFWKSTELPTLGQARGKIVILDNTPKSPGFGPFWNTLQIQDEYEVPNFTWEPGANWKWERARKFFLKTTSGDLSTAYVNFLSGFNILAGPGDIARGVNKKARDFLKPSNEDMDRAGWVFMDFPGPSLIYSVLYHN